MDFLDVEGARKAGHSDFDIVREARRAGYSDDEIAGDLDKGGYVDMRGALAAGHTSKMLVDAFAGTQQKAAPSGVVDTAIDAGKGFGSGVAKGAIQLAGTPGDVGGLAKQNPKTAAALASALPGVGLPALLFSRLMNEAGATSGNIRKGVESVTGELYEPQTAVGKFAGTAGEMAPNLIGGPGGLGRRAATQWLLPALASEGAGQGAEALAGKGSTLEAIARPVAAVAAAVAAGRLPGAPRTAPSQEQVREAAERGFDRARAADVRIDPAAVSTLATRIEQELLPRGLGPRLAGGTHAVLDDMRAAPQGAWASISDLHTMRQELGILARETSGLPPLPTPNATAASAALRRLDEFLRDLPPGAVMQGDAALASQTLRTAIGNNASFRAAERVTEAMRQAELNAAAANSGMNLKNTQRAQIKQILKSPSRQHGYTEEELGALGRVLSGTRLTDGLRTIGNMFGGGGGLGTTFAGALYGGIGYGLGGAETGFTAAAAAPILGISANALAARAQTNMLNRVEGDILRRSPLGRSRFGQAQRPNLGTLALIAATAALHKSGGERRD